MSQNELVDLTRPKLIVYNGYMTQGIYCIKHTKSNKIYVGQSGNIERRKAEHFSALKKGNHHCVYLQRSYNLHNPSDYEFEILESVDSQSDLTPREQWWFDYYKGIGYTTYNPRPNVDSNLGLKRTDEAKRKMSIAHAGISLSESHKQSISKAGKGRVHSTQTKKKIGEKNKGRKPHYTAVENSLKSRVKPVYQIDKETDEIIKTWDCIMDIERELNINHSAISSVCLGKRKTAGGYKWQYKEGVPFHKTN